MGSRLCIGEENCGAQKSIASMVQSVRSSMRKVSVSLCGVDVVACGAVDDSKLVTRGSWRHLYCKWKGMRDSTATILAIAGGTHPNQKLFLNITHSYSRKLVRGLVALSSNFNSHKTKTSRLNHIDFLEDMPQPRHALVLILDCGDHQSIIRLEDN
ncbi:hypothetical protein BRADI_1g12316v3 [Brachypodium distachyon]|uniref:Uncharacterized protein n=1 Tax=Brachypodium distachyon TaxID=15368 RepID=A0A2K2DJ66_BRADI|nr:hypothetical protein BRADI_1g12316v3 [Brachypodium distachyon]